MPNYRRPDSPGATWFITVVSHNRLPLFAQEAARMLLHGAIAATKKDDPFAIEQQVLLPDHWHIALTLPEDSADISTRIAAIKARFTSTWLKDAAVEVAQSTSRERQGYRAVWQKRFWDHVSRDDDDFIHICQYIWYNPVKHALVSCPHAWPYSSFHRAVTRGLVERDWQCVCGDKLWKPPTEIMGAEMD